MLRSRASEVNVKQHSIAIVNHVFFRVNLVALAVVPRNQHVKRLPGCMWPASLGCSPSSCRAPPRIREEALMGDVALNASVKLHMEAAEHARQARHEQLELGHEELEIRPSKTGIDITK